MNKSLLAVAALLAASLPASAQVLADWTFETTLPASSGTFAAELGIFASSSFASGSHAGASTYSSPVGNGSAHSFSSNTWAVGDYYQFTTSTTGYSGIAVSWDQISSSTGPGSFTFSYSLTGLAGSFTPVGSAYTVLANSSPNIWTSATSITASSYSLNLSSITALNNAGTVYFRLTDTSTTAANNGTVATAGTDRVDNFTVSLIPEPSTYALILGVVGLGCAALRRRFSNLLAAA